MALRAGLGNSKLPELFEVIIAHDRVAPDLRSSIINLAAVREWRDRRAELVRAAERFIKRQKGGK